MYIILDKKETNPRSSIINKLIRYSDIVLKPTDDENLFEVIKCRFSCDKIENFQTRKSFYGYEIKGVIEDHYTVYKTNAEFSAHLWKSVNDKAYDIHTQQLNFEAFDFEV